METQTLTLKVDEDCPSILSALARECVGDSGSPNLFFVSLNAKVVMVTEDGDAAHDLWETFVRQSPRLESALEDRHTGCISSREPDEDTGRLVTIDDYVREGDEDESEES